MVSRCSGAMPGPVSSTETRTLPAEALPQLTDTHRRPPGDERAASMAFATRFETACVSWTAFPETWRPSGAGSARSWTRALSASWLASRQHLRHQPAHVDGTMLRAPVPEQRPDRLDDLAGPVAVVDDARQGPFRLADFRLLPFEPAQRGIGVGHHAGHRLGDFVRDRRRKGFHRREPAFPGLTLGGDGTGQARAERGGLDQQRHEHDAGGNKAEGAADPPGKTHPDTAADVGEQHEVRQQGAENDHQPEIQRRAPPPPERGQRREIERDHDGRHDAPQGADEAGVAHQGRQEAIARDDGPGQRDGDEGRCEDGRDRQRPGAPGADRRPRPRRRIEEHENRKTDATDGRDVGGRLSQRARPEDIEHAREGQHPRRHKHRGKHVSSRQGKDGDAPLRDEVPEQQRTGDELDQEQGGRIGGKQALGPGQRLPGEGSGRGKNERNGREHRDGDCALGATGRGRGEQVRPVARRPGDPRLIQALAGAGSCHAAERVCGVHQRISRPCHRAREYRGFASAAQRAGLRDRSCSTSGWRNRPSSECDGSEREMVRSRRLELPRGLAHSDLNAARLPIPPRPHWRGF